MGDDGCVQSSGPRERYPEPLTDAPAPMRKKRTTQDMIAENKGPGLLVTSLRTLAGLAIAVAIVAVIWFVAAAIEGDDPSPRAPWDAPSAPVVPPAPLIDQ